MKTQLRILTFMLTLFSASASFAAPPANDSILTATKLAGNYAVQPAQDLSLATSSTLDPLINGAGAGKSVWFVFPGQPRSGDLVIQIQSATAMGYLGVFDVYDPDNMAGSLDYQNHVAITQGGVQSLKIHAGSRAIALMVSGIGTFTLSHHFSESNAANDFPSSAYLLSGERGTEYGDNQMATVSADEPALPNGTAAMFNTLWFKWTPSFTDKAYLDTNFSCLDGDSVSEGLMGERLHQTQIVVCTGTPDHLTPVAFDAMSGYASVNSFVELQAVAGETLYIAVGTRAGSQPGQFMLNYYRGGSNGEIYLAGDFYKGSTMETAGYRYIDVRRRYAAPGTAASCKFSTLPNGDATPGKDYMETILTLNFSIKPATRWQYWVPIPLIDDGDSENQYEEVAFEISNPSPNTTLDNTNGHFALGDDESLQQDLNSLYIPNSKLRVSEGAGSLEIMVKRRGIIGDSQDLSAIPWGGSAAQGLDYYVDTGFILSDEDHASLYVLPIDDDAFEGDETAFLYIPGAGYVDITIEDDDPYLPVAGTLVAALDFANGARQAALVTTVSSIGVLTGKLSIPGQTLPFTAKLDTHGKATVSIAPAGRPIFVISFAARNEEGDFDVSLLDARTTSKTMRTARVQSYNSKTNPCPLAGAYTLTGGAVGKTVIVTAAAAINVGANGTATISGRTFDNSPFTMAGVVDGNGTLCAVTSLYGTGALGVRGVVPSAVGQVANLDLKINRPARANDPAKLGAFIATVPSNTARYTPPPAGQPALETWIGGSGNATLSGGGLLIPLSKALTVSKSSVITAPADQEKLKLTIVPATGMFMGGFVAPPKLLGVKGTTMPIFGALTDLPGTNGFGKGFFFDGAKGGLIVLGK